MDTQKVVIRTSGKLVDSHALFVEIFCQRQFPKEMEQGKMNLSSYQNGANNYWLVLNPVKIPTVLPKEYGTIEFRKF